MAESNLLKQISDQLIGSAPSFETRSLASMTPEQQALLRQLIAAFQQEGLTTGGVTPFEGELTAGLGELEGLSLEALEQQILQRVQGTGVGAETNTALTDLLRTGGAPVDFEDFFQKSIRDPALQEFRELILPEVTRRFGSSGAFGSDRLLAEQQATERLGKTLAGSRSELAFRTQGEAQNRRLQALGLSPGIQTGGVEDLLKLMQGAALPRSIEQSRLTAEFGEFQRQQGEKNKRIEQILASLGLKTTDNLGAGLGGQRGEIGQQASSTKSALGQVFSDRRLKSDIVLIGLLPSGLNLYRFRYKFDPAELRFGVMADEVEKLLPEAVIARDDGMKLVDYTMLSELGLL